MDVHATETTSPEPHVGGADRDTFRLAAKTWLTLQASGVPPSPRNFELWFTHLEGTNPELSRRMDEMLQNGHRPVPEVLESIYAECLSSRRDADFEMLEDGAEEIEQVARETATQLAAGHRYLQEYGSVLSTVGVQLSDQQTVESLVKTVATLAAETTRASDINCSLEARLTASASQVQRLRQSLARVKEETTIDALTGLVNRRGFDARLRRAMTRHKSENTPACLLIADVDRFKSFNDTYGHKTGDLVLRLVGRLLESVMHL